MKIKIENHQENTTRVIEYPFNVLQFLKINLLWLGIYRAESIGVNAYNVYCKLDGSRAYTVSKAKKSDPVTE